MRTDLECQPEFVSRESLDAARAGSPVALGQVLDAFRNYLLAVARRELPADLRAKAGASDLVQETFFEAQRDFAAFQGQSEAELLVWMRRILLHNLEDFVRHYRSCAKRQVGLETPLGDYNAGYGALNLPPADDQTPSQFAVANEQLAGMQQAMSRLNEDYQTVLRLRYWEGRQFDDIGRIMGRSGEAARKVWFRAVQALQRELNPVDDEVAQ